jgi:uncharacterized protein with PQ loop repeat
MPKLEALVGMAGTIGLISFSTLLQRIYKTHNTESLPWAWICMNISAQLLSFTYGIANHAYGIFIPNSLFLCGLLYILYVKIIYKDSEKEDGKKKKDDDEKNDEKNE